MEIKLNLSFNSKTKSASETVFKTIKYFNIRGQIIVKDSDSYFLLNKNFNLRNKNFIAGVDISEHPEVYNIHQKSFLRLNNKNQIIDIEEKKIYFRQNLHWSLLLYSAQDFIEHYKNCQKILKIKKYI